MLRYLFIAFFMWGIENFADTDSKNPHYYNPKNCDYIYNFLKTDINDKTLRKVYKTQAYNTIRIVWENSCALTSGTQSLHRKAANKARKYLLSLENLEDYKYDSGLQLAIALSYFLENQAQYDKIRFHMQKWLDLGREIPKNLVKMTDYEGSLQTINRLCKNVALYNDATFQ